MMEPLPPGNSNWVSGARFFNRVNEKRLLIEQVEAGTAVLLTGQRRVGKTSLAHEVGRVLTERGWSLVFVDLDDCSTCQDFVAALAEAVAKVTPLRGLVRSVFSAVRGVLDRVEEVAAADVRIKVRDRVNAGDWGRYGASLFQALVDTEDKVLLVIDELPNLVLRLHRTEGEEAVERFMSWLRKAVQSHGGQEGFSLVVSGSIGLQPTLSRMGLTATVNEIFPFRLRPWDKETSVACIEARFLHHEHPVEREVVEHMVAKLGICIPHHVQRFATRVHEFLVTSNACEPSKRDVDLVYEQSILTQDGESLLSHYESRLKEALSVDLWPVGIKLLTALSDAGSLTDREIDGFAGEIDGQDADRDLQWVLHVLEHDGYLMHQDNRYIFPEGLLRDWWRQRYIPGRARYP